MKTVDLGGEPVSQLALGCMIMGTSTDEPTSVELLNRYVDAGGTVLDTANCYAWWLHPGSGGGESEELLGRWFARTDRVDLYYVHVDDRATPLEETPETLEALEALEALAGIVAAGQARHIGWSNVATWRLERIRALCARPGWPAPVALQQQHSYLRRRAGLTNTSIVDSEQLDYLECHPDLRLVAYSPILKGIYDDPAKRAGHWAMAPYEGPDSQARLTVLGEVVAEQVTRLDGAGA